MNGFILNASKVKDLVAENKTSYMALSRQLGHNEGYIGCKLFNNRPFSKKEAEIIAKELGCETKDIKKGDKDMMNKDTAMKTVYVDYNIIKKCLAEKGDSLSNFSKTFDPIKPTRIKDSIRRRRPITVETAEAIAKALCVDVDYILVSNKPENKEALVKDGQVFVNLSDLKAIAAKNNSSLAGISRAMGKSGNYISGMSYLKHPIDINFVKKAEKALGFKIMDAFYSTKEEKDVEKAKEYILVVDKFDEAVKERGVTREWVETLANLKLDAEKYDEATADKIAFILCGKRDDIFAEWIEPEPEPEPEPEVIPAQVGEFKVDTSGIEKHIEQLDKTIRVAVGSNYKAAKDISDAVDKLDKISGVLKVQDILTGLELCTNKLNAMAVQNARMLEKIVELEKKVNSTPDKKQLAVIFLENELKNGRMKVSTIKDDASKLDISFNDLMYAKKKLFVKAETSGMGHNTESYWYI